MSLRKRLSLVILALATIASPAWGLGPNSGGSHTVRAGQRLASIAKRYGVSISAICQVNNIKASSKLMPGQRLVIPGLESKPQSTALPETSKSGAKSSTSRRSEKSRSAPKQPSSSRRLRRKGHVAFVKYQNKWRGPVVTKRGRILPAARRALSKMLGATGSRPAVPDRLIRLIVGASDAFGGRPIRLVSGYRTTSYFHDSRHRHSEAVDFSIPGVPNSALRDYLRTLPQVGVGYYPNSSFVHLDVRKESAYWVDYSAPGERPRRTPRRRNLPSNSEALAVSDQRAESPPPHTAEVTSDNSESTVDATGKSSSCQSDCDDDGTDRQD